MRNRTSSLVFVIGMVTAVLGLAGCSPEAVDSESVGTQREAVVLPRKHQEFFDSDGLFVTYWERDHDASPADDIYTAGVASMDTKPFGYTAFVDNTGLAADSNLVVGKGRKP